MRKVCQLSITFWLLCWWWAIPFRPLCLRQYLLSSVFSFSHNGPFCTENSKYLDEISRKYQSPVRVWMGPNLYIFIHDAECAEQVLKGRKTLSKPTVYQAISDALGADGLFSSNGNCYIIITSNPILCYWHLMHAGEHWKLHRKLMSPSLKDSTVFSHLSIFNFYIREFCNTKLDEEAQNGKPFDVMLPLNVVLLSMYLDATLGIEWHQKTAYANFFSE